MKANEILKPEFSSVIDHPVTDMERLDLQRMCDADPCEQSIKFTRETLAIPDLTHGRLIEQVWLAMNETIDNEQYWSHAMETQNYPKMLKHIDDIRLFWNDDVVNEVERKLNNRYQQHLLSN